MSELVSEYDAPKDLDETRRLLYIALAAHRLERPGAATLAGTLVNALVHHSELEVDAAECMNAAVATIEGSDGTWANGLIDTITQRLAT